MTALLALLVLLAPQAPSRWPVESLTVEGNSRYPAERVLAAAGLALGQEVGKEELEAAMARLAESGHFVSAGYHYRPSASGKGYQVTIEVAEIEETYPLRFERLDAPARDLEEWLRRFDPLFAGAVPGTEECLARYARAIEAFFEAQGKKIAVAGRVAPGDGGGLEAVFGPAEPLPVVAAVRFSGNNVLPAATLANTLAGVASGTPYEEARFREVLEANIRPLYEARGRMRVAFPTIRAEPAEGVKGVVVMVEVEEGDVYQLDQVRIEAEEAEARELLAAAGIRTGGVADFSLVEAGLERIRRRLRGMGYLRAQTLVERNIRDAEKKVDLVIRLERGPRYTFGRLGVAGLDLDGEAAIRRLWGLKPGAPYDEGYAEHFLARIREEALFDNLGRTRVEAKVDEATRTVDVTLRFEGARLDPRRSSR